MKNDINKLIIRKDNTLVQKAINNLNKTQNKLMCILLGKYVNLEDNECIDTTISVTELLDILDLTKCADNYQAICTAISDFGNKGSVGFLEVDEKGRHRYVWMPYFSKITCDDNLISFKWNDEMKQFLTVLKSNYTQYLASDYLLLNSIYSQNLYEWLKSVANYKKTYKKDPSISLEQLREILRVGDKYKEYKNFKTVCLDRAIKEINEVTDLLVDVNTIKQGKEVTGLQFIIKQKRKNN